MRRRDFAALVAGGLGSPWLQAAGPARDAEATTTLALAWRGPRDGDPHHAGRVRIDWAAGRVTLLHEVTLPGRPHGLLLEPDGALIVCAARPGTWLWRIDAEGRVQTRRQMADDPQSHTLDGHAIVSADGQHLITTQTDARSGQGHVAVRDLASLATVAVVPTHGRDPHQLLLDAEGHLVVANGGIPRDDKGRKHDLARMRPSLVRLDLSRGDLLGQWTLDDPRLSLRHIAYGATASKPLLGIALQAEHDDPAERAKAPLLAVWDGGELRTVPSPDGLAGYAGDIAAAPEGGFVVSAQRVGKVLHWRPDGDAGWTLAGQLTDACGLAQSPAGRHAVAMLGARGAGRWHPAQPAAMLAWPQPMAVDNHCVVVVDTV